MRIFHSRIGAVLLFRSCLCWKARKYIYRRKCNRFLPSSKKPFKKCWLSYPLGEGSRPDTSESWPKSKANALISLTQTCSRKLQGLQLQCCFAACARSKMINSRNHLSSGTFCWHCKTIWQPVTFWQWFKKLPGVSSWEEDTFHPIYYPRESVAADRAPHSKKNFWFFFLTSSLTAGIELLFGIITSRPWEVLSVQRRLCVCFLKTFATKQKTASLCVMINVIALHKQMLME